MSGPTPEGPYLVLGCGRAGLAAAEALAGIGDPPGVTVWDAFDGSANRARSARLTAAGVSVELGAWQPRLLQRVSPRIVIKSPGVPADAVPVRDSLRLGIPVIDELDLGGRLSRRQLVAVTGTDGKSTVCSLLASALGNGTPVAGNTEFGVPLSALPRTGGPAVVEVSSYQLEFSFEPFAALAVLTNLTREHLHRHGTMDAYAAIKRRLFLLGDRNVPRAVLNVDSEAGRSFARRLTAAGSQVATFGAERDADYRILESTWGHTTARTRVGTADGELVVDSRLPGRHNADNVTAALAASDLLGLPRAPTLAAIAAADGVPGRWDHVEAGQPFRVIVDFAHTEAGLGSVLRTARSVADREGDASISCSRRVAEPTRRSAACSDGSQASSPTGR